MILLLLSVSAVNFNKQINKSSIFPLPPHGQENQTKWIYVILHFADMMFHVLPARGKFCRIFQKRPK